MLRIAIICSIIALLFIGLLIKMNERPQFKKFELNKEQLNEYVSELCR